MLIERIDGAAGQVQAGVHFEHANDEKESGTVPSAGARLADFYSGLVAVFNPGLVAAKQGSHPKPPASGQ
jgi:hypothetical protein